VQHLLRGPNFLIWVLGGGGRGGEVFLFLFGVADVFRPCSQVVYQVLNVFPKGVLNSTGFQTHMFAQNLPLFTYITGVFLSRGINPGEKL